MAKNVICRIMILRITPTGSRHQNRRQHLCRRPLSSITGQYYCPLLVLLAELTLRAFTLRSLPPSSISRNFILDAKKTGDDIPAAALFLLLQGNIIARLLPHLLSLQGIYLLPAENHLLLFLRLHSRQSI